MAAPLEVRSERRPGLLATALATLCGNAYLVVGTLFWSVASLLGSPLPSRRRWAFAIARSWSRGWLAASGVRLVAEWEAAADPHQPVVYMANHQSYLDIPALFATLPGETSMLAKRSLFRLPFFGWAMRAGGFVPVDRDDKTSARSSFDEAADRLRQGASVLVFPEGRRSLDGRLGPLQRGGFLLAIRTGRRIVPVGIEGSLAIQPKGSLVLRPGTLTLRYGRPIDVAAYGVRSRGELTTLVARELERLARCESAEAAATVG